MYLFIDESRNFQVAPENTRAVSCASCLVIPEEIHEAVKKDFATLKNVWGISATTEVKGRELDESQIASVVRLLNAYDVILETVAIDMSRETETGLSHHKNLQADKLLENVTSEHHPRLVESLKKAQNSYRLMPNQLYVQNVVMVRLVANIVQRASLYYSQWKPKELGRFCWIIDAKDRTITRYEDFWRKITLPALQSIGFETPLLLLRGADYSSFTRFYGEMSETPVHLQKARRHKTGHFDYIKINEIMKETSFEDSVNVPCLQLVDVLCNAIQRAMNGNLKPQGWDLIGCLTVQPRQGDNVIQFITLTGHEGKRKVPYADVLRKVDQSAKPMLSHHD
ncbi:MAG: hypothetical protein CV089_12635 [Nitrospira sp. WS110]|nr:hypothetical protein [Nitrospira sp. WS110]